MAFLLHVFVWLSLFFCFVFNSLFRLHIQYVLSALYIYTHGFMWLLVRALDR